MNERIDVWDVLFRAWLGWLSESVSGERQVALEHRLRHEQPNSLAWTQVFTPLGEIIATWTEPASGGWDAAASWTRVQEIIGTPTLLAQWIKSWQASGGRFPHPEHSAPDEWIEAMAGDGLRRRFRGRGWRDAAQASLRRVIETLLPSR
ncbi:MAG TPA: hypothetical protein VF384_03975 [Planctomycetota bacterium]